MKILVIGAGAWGTAMAISAATHPDKRAVSLWARDLAQAQLMQAERANSRYLPGIRFPEPLTVVSGDVMAHAATADLIVLGTPMAALRSGWACSKIAACPWSGCAKALKRCPPMLPLAAMA